MSQRHDANDSSDDTKHSFMSFPWLSCLSVNIFKFKWLCGLVVEFTETLDGRAVMDIQRKNRCQFLIKYNYNFDADEGLDEG